MANTNKPKKQRWYLGGFAGTGAVMVTHPVDLLNVQLQKQQHAKKTLHGLGVQVLKNDGIRSLYSGISASIMRQMTYTTVRFGLYEVISSKLLEGRSDCLPFYQKTAVGFLSGFVGGIAGNTADVVKHVNDMKQNDMKLPKELQRNYRQIFSGLYRVSVEDGARTLFAGVSMTAMRGLLITFGQISVYDQIKQMLLSTGCFNDTTPTHIATSLMAATVATTVTQPFDVIKTRLMNAKPGEYDNVRHCARHLYQVGKMSGVATGVLPEGRTAGRSRFYRLSRQLLAGFSRQLGVVVKFWREFWREFAPVWIQRNLYQGGKMSRVATGVQPAGFSRQLGVVVKFWREFAPVWIKRNLYQVGKMSRVITGVLPAGLSRQLLAGLNRQLGGVVVFWQGFALTWIRLAPQTIVMWIFLEQLRATFPYKYTKQRK